MGVEAKIPEKETGNLLSAITDCIRPFSEKQGLKADQIRLQREDVLYEITKKARKRAELEEADLSPIPNKTLVPLLEKASLEDIADEEMQERWASLMVSESQQHHSRNLTFVDMLSRLSSNELNLLEDKCLSFSRFPELSYPHGHFPDNERTITYHAQKLSIETLGDAEQSPIEAKKAYDLFINESSIKDLQYVGVLYATVQYMRGAHCYFYTDYHAQNDSLEILKREQLIELVNLKAHGVEIGYFNVTRLGVKFVETCCPKIRKKKK